MAEVKEDRGREVVITFLEVSRAHLHSSVRRKVFVGACGEDTKCPLGHSWQLMKAMYGLRDASAAFDKMAVQSLFVQLRVRTCWGLAVRRRLRGVGDPQSNVEIPQ